MLEVIEYLQDNDFIIYIVSGSDRFTVRSLIEGHIDIPKNYVIRTEARMVATHEGDTDGFIYTFRQDDVMVFEGKLLIKDLYIMFRKNLDARKLPKKNGSFYFIMEFSIFLWKLPFFFGIFL